MNKELYDKKVGCPVCNKEHTTKKVRSSAIRMTKRDEDFCPYYNSENPLFYGVFVCPNCGYSSLESSFMKISNSEKEKIKTIITAKWNQRSFEKERTLEEAIEVYKLALLGHQIINSKGSIIGKICLRLAWFYRYTDDPREYEFIKNTISSFEKAFTTERTDNEEFDEVTVFYLLGELNRRIEKYQDAIQWFDKTLKHKDIKSKRHIELRARDQWTLTREQFNNMKSITI